MGSTAAYAEQKAALLAFLDVVPSVPGAARELGINRNTACTWARQAGIRSTRVEHIRPERRLLPSVPGG